MLCVTIICLGKLKEKYLRDACDEYAKRLQTLCKLKVMELSPVALSDNPSDSEIASALEKEADMIMAKLPKNPEIFALCIEGKQLSSEELSRKTDDIALSGKSDIVFVIGSSYGLSDRIKSFANHKLSMSKMTFPHQLARVMLLEQIYRARQISLHTKYHK